MPAGSVPLRFITELGEQSGEEGARFQGALGAQASREYLHREGSRASGEAEEPGGLATIPTVYPGAARVHARSPGLWQLWGGSWLSFPLEDASLFPCEVVGRNPVWWVLRSCLGRLSGDLHYMDGKCF